VREKEIRGTHESLVESFLTAQVHQRVVSALVGNLGVVRGDMDPKQNLDEAIGKLVQQLHVLASPGTHGDKQGEVQVWEEVLRIATVRISTLVCDREIFFEYEPGDQRPDDMETRRTFTPEQWVVREDDRWRESSRKL
jgi:hypothetical protein